MPVMQGRRDGRSAAHNRALRRELFGADAGSNAYRNVDQRNSDYDEQIEQDATADVLRVINASPAPHAVFDAIVERRSGCARLPWRFVAFDGEKFQFVVLRGIARLTSIMRARLAFHAGGTSER